MNLFTQHIPSFVEVEERPRAQEFDGLEALLGMEALQWHSKRPSFSHFAVSGRAIMAISDEGFHWWVVGFVSNPQALGLPEWDYGKYMVSFDDNAPIEIPGRDVYSTCGNEVTLRGGRVGNKRR